MYYAILKLFYNSLQSFYYEVIKGDGLVILSSFNLSFSV